MPLKLAGLFLAVVGFMSQVRLAWADAFVLNNGTFRTFSVPGASPDSTIATGVNDSGQIVGYFSDSTGRHGFLDTNGVFTTINFPSAALTDASGINNAGQIVGGFQATLAQLPQGFLETSGIFSVILGLGAAGINSSGQIVGTLGMPGITSETAFLDTNGAVIPLMLPSPVMLFLLREAASTTPAKLWGSTFPAVFLAIRPHKRASVRLPPGSSANRKLRRDLAPAQSNLRWRVILPRLIIEWRKCGNLAVPKHPKNVPGAQEASCPTRKRSFLLRSLPQPTKLTIPTKARSIAWLAMRS